MMESKKRELEAEMTYKKTLLDIENDEIIRYVERINNYMENKFKAENENYIKRMDFYGDANFLKTHIDKSRALLEEIEGLEVELGIKEDIYS